MPETTMTTRYVLTTMPNIGNESVNWNLTTSVHLEPHQLIWTNDVIFRVTTIVIVMAMTIVGNTSLIAIIGCHRKLRYRRVNIFLLNLAIGDLMVCFVTMTTEILFVAFGEWVLGAVTCRLVVYGQMVTLASAIFLLTAMSIDRYQVLVKPLKSLAGPPKIWRKVVVAWTLALIFATPQLFIFVQTNEGVHPDGRIKHLCTSKGYTAKWQRKFYFTFITVYILVVPSVIMTFCYANIIRVVWMRNDVGARGRRHRLRFIFRKNHSDGQTSSDTEQAFSGDVPTARRSGIHQGQMLISKRMVSSSKRKVIVMTLSVIIAFLICWTPYVVVSLIRIYSDYKIRLVTGRSVAEIMAMAHSALNPILYGIFSTRTAVRVYRQVCCFCRGGLQNTAPGEETVMSDDETAVPWTEPRVHKTSTEIRTSENQRLFLYHRILEGMRPLFKKCNRQKTNKDKFTVYHQLVPKNQCSHCWKQDAMDYRKAPCSEQLCENGENCVGLEIITDPNPGPGNDGSRISATCNGNRLCMECEIVENVQCTSAL